MNTYTTTHGIFTEVTTVITHSDGTTHRKTAHYCDGDYTHTIYRVIKAEGGHTWSDADEFEMASCSLK